MKIDIDNHQCKDAGLALLLILLLIAIFSASQKLILPSILLLVLIMSVPALFKPFAVIWFAFSHYIGILSSKVILTILFFTIITPVGLIRRLFRADPLLLNGWSSSSETAFKKDNYLYKKSDMMHPY